MTRPPNFDEIERWMAEQNDASPARSMLDAAILIAEAEGRRWALHSEDRMGYGMVASQRICKSLLALRSRARSMDEDKG